MHLSQIYSNLKEWPLLGGNINREDVLQKNEKENGIFFLKNDKNIESKKTTNGKTLENNGKGNLK